MSEGQIVMELAARLAQALGQHKTKISVMVNGNDTRASSVQRLQPTSRYAPVFYISGRMSAWDASSVANIF